MSTCYTGPKVGWAKATDTCRAHVTAVGSSREELVIKSVNLNHTCTRLGNNIKRKCNYKTKDISCGNQFFEVYEPARGGNTKPFINMTKPATGVTLKTVQAALAVQSKSCDTLEAHIGQYFRLSSLFDNYQKSDPSGTYILESVDCRWDLILSQFRCCCTCLLIAIHFWSCASIRLLVCDGTHTKTSSFNHIVLIAMSYDANNNIFILAIAVVGTEDADNWVWFKEHLEVDFLGISVWMSDANKGIRSISFSLSMSQSEDVFVLSRCTRHLADNCKENCSGTMNEEHKTMIVELGHSLSEVVYQKRLEAI
jgi:hypothetical protein